MKNNTTRDRRQTGQEDVSATLENMPFFSRLTVQVVFVLATLAVGSLVGINLFFLSFIDAALQKNLGENMVLATQQVMEVIERDVLNEVDRVKVVASSRELQRTLIASNASFAANAERDASVREMDQAWVAAPKGTTTPFMEAIAESDASAALQNFVSEIRLTHGYPVFGEVFVTNTYGVNAGQTNRTSDYYQADEEWWQMAVRDDVYLGSVSYDESSGINAMDVAVAVRDVETGALLGVVKAVLGIRGVISDAQELIQSEERGSVQKHIAHGHLSHDTVSFALFDGDQHIVTATPAVGRGDADASTLLKTVDVTKDGYFFIQRGLAKEALVAHAHADILQWTLLLENGVSEILAPTKTAINRFLLVVGFLFVLFFCVTLLLTTRHITHPLIQLAQTARVLAAGDLSAQVRVEGRGEIGALAQAFNVMAGNLRVLYQNLEGKVSERTRALSEALRNLESKNEDLEKVNKVMVDRELKMISLKQRLAELERASPEPES